MALDFRHVVADMKDALGASDQAIHHVWDEVLPALDEAAKLGAAISASPLGSVLEAALGLSPVAQAALARVLSQVAQELAHIDPTPPSAPPAPSQPPAGLPAISG